MTLCTSSEDLFPACKSKKITAAFDGGNVSSHGGMLLLRQVDRKLNLIQEAAKAFPDSRRKASCEHRIETMLRQRVFALASGEEDLNDHIELRKDILVQTAVNRDGLLASSPTLCRFENQANRESAVALHRLMVEQFIASFDQAPEELILDFDATDNPIHGMQEGRFFHGYYDKYCLLPLYVFCGDQILTSYLRPSNIDAAKHAWAILSLLVKRLRKEWPEVRIIFRADSGFCRHRMLNWMENNNVGYCVGIARNKVLERKAGKWSAEAKRLHEADGQKHQVIGECYGRHRHQEVLKFLRKIDKEYENGEELHLIMDNYCTHKHTKVRAWLEKRPRFHIHFIPTSSSWLNLVERWFADLTQKAVRRGSFTSVPDLIEKVMEFIESHNEDASPFVWTATAETILEKIEKCRRRLEEISPGCTSRKKRRTA
jgi:transposase